jgi:hypothetical protein
VIKVLKFTGRWALRALLLLVILVVVLVLLKDRIFQSWVVGRLEKSTGLQVTLRGAEIDLRSGKVRFEGLKLFNPKEYGDTPFLHFEELQVEADRVELKHRKLHFRLLHINLAELNIVEDKAGKLNLQAIKEQIDRVQKESKPGKPSSGDDRPESPMEFIGIDTLHLTLGKVRKISLNYPDMPVVTDLEVRDQVMKDIRTQEDFQNKVLPVLLRGGVAVLYQIWMESQHRQVAPAPPAP